MMSIICYYNNINTTLITGGIKIDIAAVVALIILSAFFSAAETAFSGVNRLRLQSYLDAGDKRARRAVALVKSYDRTITSIIVCDNLINITAATLGTVIFTRLLGEGHLWLSVIVMTVAVLIFGEIVPKSFAKERAEEFCLIFGGVINAVIVVLTPIIAVFIGVKKLMSFINRGNTKTQPSVTEQELISIIDRIENEGVLEESESDLVKNALIFDETTLEEILIPRVDVVAIEVNEDIEKIKSIFLTERYSRMPVYDKTIDNIVGVVHEKDFFTLYIEGGRSISGITQKTIYLPGLMKLSDAFATMQRLKLHMAIVTDQYGGTEGIVTLEDILEELVGEIWDENDEVLTPVFLLEPGKYEVSAELSLHDMLDELELDQSMIESGHNSVGGWVLELFGRIPEPGATIAHGIFTVTVIEVDEQRIIKILLEVASTDKNEDEDNE